MNFIRYPFFCVNILFMLFGITIMSLGILLLTNYSALEQMLHNLQSPGKNSNFSESVYNQRTGMPVLLQPSPEPRWLTRIRDPACYLLIGLGAFYFSLSFVGCCGSVKDSRRLMIIYGALLVILFITQCVGVSLYFKYKPNLRAEVANAINDQYKPEEMHRFTKFEFILDLLMINYKCCGVNNERDFKEAYSHFYSVRSLNIDPRFQGKGKTPHSVVLHKTGEGETTEETIMIEDDDVHSTAYKNTDANGESRVVTGEETENAIVVERQVPVSCCKLNLSDTEATSILRNIYRNQESKLQLLDFAIDNACVTAPDETNAYVGDFHGCFDKIQGEFSSPLLIGLIIVGVLQLCGLVFAGFIFKAAFYDWNELTFDG